MRSPRLTMLGLLLASAIATQPASAANFRWANDGDVSAMDPDTRQETVQLSFLSNIYEPLVRRDREPERWSRRWRSAGNRPARRSGASICART